MAGFILHTEWYGSIAGSMSAEQFTNVIQAVCACMEGDGLRYFDSNEEAIAFDFILDGIRKDRREHPEIFEEDE